MNLQLFGIGAELYSDEGYCTIRRVTPTGRQTRARRSRPRTDCGGGPEQRAHGGRGGHESQQGRAVDSRPEGAEVRLTVHPGGDPSERRIVTLIRDEIKLEENEAKAKVIEVSATRARRFGWA